MIKTSDAAYANLLKFIKEDRERGEASRKAYAEGSRKYWYYVAEDYCPVCGDTEQIRYRMYTPRPDAWEERHSVHESYDGCEGY